MPGLVDLKSGIAVINKSKTFGIEGNATGSRSLVDFWSTNNDTYMN